MIREFAIIEFEKFGADAKLVDRLLVYGKTPFLTWLTRRSVDRAHVNQSLEALSMVLGLPLTKIQYAYFRAPETPLEKLKKGKEYAYLMDTLTRVYPYPALWDSLLPVAGGLCRKVAAELLLETGSTPTAIANTLKISERTVYDIRKRFLTEYVQQKGDGK